MTTRPLAITCGEPAGIGPDLTIALAAEQREQAWVAIADPRLLTARAAILGIALEVVPWQPGQPVETTAGRVSVYPVAGLKTDQPGRLDAANAPYVIETLRVAGQGCLDGLFSGMVTAPVHKGIINDAGIAFSGHTEYLQELCKTQQVVMMLATTGLRVALVTTHLPLSEVPAAITSDRLRRVLTILDADLRKWFGIACPTILVAGLNPHAGEGGHMGREEIDIIEPVLEELCSVGLNILGPLPADTLFTPKWLDQADAVLAMYHDQGLPVLKYKGFGNAVNVTLGLPIIRTSVDHGTATDLAGTGRADSGSLRVAIRYAAEMVERSRVAAELAVREGKPNVGA